MKMQLYVEGGGDRNFLNTQCRKAFQAFLGKAGLEGGLPRVFACGSRQQAYKDFCHALDTAHNGEFIVLLVDSESSVAEGAEPWLHLKNRDNWDKPAGAMDENAHPMVQCMEAWFLADKEALAGYFGDDFNMNSLPGRLEVEAISKSDIEAGLKAATRQCKKGQYDKGSHSFGILAELDPDKVTGASPQAERFINTLLKKTS